MARQRLKVIKLKKPKLADDTRFIDTLVWVLDQARQGKVTNYVMVFEVEREDGVFRSMEAANLTDPVNWHHVLGLIEDMKMNFIKRNWPQD